MLGEGLIEHSTSPFSSPIIWLRRRIAHGVFCTNYMTLNVITIKDAYPIPIVDELLEELYGGNYFSKLDLHSGYHQILLHLDDKFKTIF